MGSGTAEETIILHLCLDIDFESMFQNDDFVEHLASLCLP